jgi:hypothetical protein
MCFCCGFGGTVINGGLRRLFGFPLPHSPWHIVVAALAGGIGGFIYVQVITDYLRPFYADYIKRELRRDAA